METRSTSYGLRLLGGSTWEGNKRHGLLEKASGSCLFFFVKFRLAGQCAQLVCRLLYVTS